LRPDVRRLVNGGVGVKIRMAIEARHAETLVRALSIFRLIEFLLRERRQQKTKPLHLHRSNKADHQLVVVLYRQKLPLGDIAQLWMTGKKNRRRKFGRELVRKVQVDVEASKVAGLLSTDLVDLIVREDLTAGRLLDMRQRHEAGWQNAALPDLVRAHGRQIIPGDPRGKFNTDTALHGLSLARHHGIRDRLI
jgi:hypothetical protein